MSQARWDISTALSYDFLSSEYRDLFARSASTVFQSPLWMDRLYKRLAVDLKAEPLIIIIRERTSGRLAVVLPLVVRQRRWLRITEFADFGVSDYCAPVCDPDLLPALCGDETVSRQIQDLLRSCDLLMVRKVRSDKLPLFGFLGHTRRSLLPFTAHATTLFAPFAAWREANMSETQRRFLDTKRRRLVKRGTLTTSAATSKQDLQHALDTIRQFRDFRFRSTGLFDLLKNEIFAQFYREVTDESHGSRIRHEHEWHPDQHRFHP